jgi:hypothetical protein
VCSAVPGGPAGPLRAGELYIKLLYFLFQGCDLDLILYIKYLDFLISAV